MNTQEKIDQYTATLYAAIAKVFDDKSEMDFHIDSSELDKGENLTLFFHALANTVPTHVFNKFTGSDKTILEFNHIANQLVFQYGKKVD